MMHHKLEFHMKYAHIFEVHNAFLISIQKEFHCLVKGPPRREPKNGILGYLFKNTIWSNFNMEKLLLINPKSINF